MFCPYGVIYPWAERKFALKCDRCAFMDNPVCVEVCPCKALELVDVEEFDRIFEYRRQEVSKKITAKKAGGMLLLDLK
jgi:Fe-S-cluster-containing hydrogenase component 2